MDRQIISLPVSQAEKKAANALAKAKGADPEKMALKELELEQVWC